LRIPPVWHPSAVAPYAVHDVMVTRCAYARRDQSGERSTLGHHDGEQHAGTL
jgi:hypothetical protein